MKINIENAELFGQKSGITYLYNIMLGIPFIRTVYLYIITKNFYLFSVPEVCVRILHFHRVLHAFL